MSEKSNSLVANITLARGERADLPTGARQLKRLLTHTTQLITIHRSRECKCLEAANTARPRPCACVCAASSHRAGVKDDVAISV